MSITCRARAKSYEANITTNPFRCAACGGAVPKGGDAQHSVSK